MKGTLQFLLLTLTGLSIAACSSTYMSGSWTDTSYQGQIKNMYIIGVARQEINRRIFEDTFSRQLANSGIKGTASYKDLPSDKEMNQASIKQRMVANGSDSVLITKIISQRSETVTTPGYASGYSSYGRGSYGGRHGYGGWGNYSRSYDVVYQPPTTTNFVVLTIESVLYDLKTEEIIWSAQLETVVEGNLEKMMQDYVETVTKDLKEKGLI